MRWLDTEKGIQAYKKHLEEIREDNRKERQRLSLIRDYERGQEVIIVHNKNEYKEKVIRIYKKTYKVSFRGDSYILIGKENLCGYPDYIIKSTTGDARRYVGEICSIKKE